MISMDKSRTRQRTCRQAITQILVAMACVGSAFVCGSAPAQVPKSVPESLKPFAPIFQKFVDGYIARRGEKGLRPVVAPDFVWNSRSENRTVTGDEAIKQAAKELGFSDYLTKEQKGTLSRSLDISSSLPEIASDGKSAVTHSFFSYGDMSLRENNTAVGGSAIGLYKETWRKTRQGWRIASIELESKQDAKKTFPVAKGDEGPLDFKKKL